MRLTKQFLESCHMRAINKVNTAYEKTQDTLYSLLANEEVMHKLLAVVIPPKTVAGLNQIAQLQETINEKFRELRDAGPDHITRTFNRSMNDNGIGRPQPWSIHSSSQARPDFILCLNLGEEHEFTVNSQKLFHPETETGQKALAAYKSYCEPYIIVSDTGYVGYGVATAIINVKEALGEEHVTKIRNMLKTAADIQATVKTVREYDVREMYTTLAKFQEDKVIWPLVKDDSWVQGWIADKEAEAERKKQEREEALKLKREKEAALRKARLEAIEKGETPPEALNDDKPVVNASLINALNRF